MLYFTRRRINAGIITASLLLLGTSGGAAQAATPRTHGLQAQQSAVELSPANAPAHFNDRRGLVGDTGVHPVVDGSWVQRTKFVADSGVENDAFGHAVFLSGDVALVGAPGDGSETGSVYIFERDISGAWNQVEELTPGDSESGDLFGTNIALQDDLALISANGDDENSEDAGAAYIFERDASGAWAQLQKLTADDASENRQFGRSVALNGDVALVGNRAEAAYFFERESSGDWAQVAKVNAHDLGDKNYFGRAVALGDDLALIGASGAYLDPTGDAGAAYIFERDTSGAWTEIQKFGADDAAEDDAFGTAVSLSGDVALIGASGAEGSVANSGAAYVFERDANDEWTQAQKLSAGDGADGDLFGISVVLSGDLALVGSGAEAAYLFERDGSGTWSQAQKFAADDATDGDMFGNAVSLSGVRALIGAYYDDDSGEKSGSAYLFSLNEPPVASDLSVSVEQDTPASITLGATDIDGDPLTYTVGDPEHGTLSGSAPDLSYTPVAGYTGDDSFTFTANDGAADSNTATVSITVSVDGGGEDVGVDTTSEPDTVSEEDTMSQEDAISQEDTGSEADITSENDTTSQNDTGSGGDGSTDDGDGCGCSSAAGPSNALSMLLVLLGMAALRLKRRDKTA